MCAKSQIHSIVRCAGLAILLAVTIVSGGCANIPKESVELSSEIGKGIAESRRAHVALLNTYFQQKKTDLDQFIENDYLEALVGNVQQGLKKAGKPDTLTTAQLRDILKEVIAERDSKHADLEKTRVLLLGKIEDHYFTLTQANSGITALLASAVAVKDATTRMTATVKTTTQGKIDLDAIDLKVNEDLKKVGGAAKKATSIYDHVKNLIEH